MSRLDADGHFLGLGVQYYAAARSASLARLAPVCGNLYHHAIEMLLKARLSQTHSLKELRCSFGHNLRVLWDAFKKQFPTAGLGQFDATVATLDRFKRIRYPDATLEEGAEIFIQWRPGPFSSTHAPGVTAPPTYHVLVTEIDRLVARIFEVCSRNRAAFTGCLSDYGREAIMRDNPAAGGWFPPRQTKRRPVAHH